MSQNTFDAEGIVVVIPAFNEAEVLVQVIDDVARFVPADQIIVVDDGSSDDSAGVASGAGAVVLRHLINRGQGAALATGIASALARGAPTSGGAKVIVTFDADHQHSAEDIPAMVEPLRAGEADVVLGTRFGGGDVGHIPPMRRLMLRLGTVFTRLFSGVRVTDTHNGFRALSAKAAELIEIKQDRMTHASEILEQIRCHKLKFVERPVRIRYSEYSMAKGQRNRDAFRILFRLLLHKVQS